MRNEKFENNRNLKKEWYLLIDTRTEGPFNLDDLRYDIRLTPDTLVWKEGFKEWTPARFVYELSELFKDATDIQQGNEDIETGNVSDIEPGPATLTLQQDPYQFFLWLIVLLLLLYISYQLSK